MAGRSYDPLVRMLKRDRTIDDTAILKLSYSNIEEMIRYAMRANTLKFDEDPDDIRGKDIPGTELISSDPMDFRALHKAWRNHYECKKAGDGDGALAYFKEAMRLVSQVAETRFKCMGCIQAVASHLQRKIEHQEQMALKSGKPLEEMTDAEVLALSGKFGTDTEPVVIEP